MEKLFEKAIRNKFRFNYKGIVSVEDLWDMPIKDLDLIFKDLNSQIKKEEQESLFGEKSLVNNEVFDKVEIIKYIAQKRMEEKELQLDKTKKQQQKQKILELLESKKEEGLMSKSEEELRDMLGKLD